MSSTVILAPKKELAADRVDRMFNESSSYEEDENSDHPSDIVLPTETTEKSKPGMFSTSHVQTLLRLFSDMTNGAPISKPVIKKDCKTTARVKK